MFTFSNPRSSRQARNPRFAPDFRLERKLSPSGVTLMTTAYVAPTTYVEPPVYPPSPSIPPTTDGTPPLVPPTDSGGPIAPAIIY